MSGVFLDSVCLSTSSSSSHISPKHIHPLVTAVTHQSTLHGLKKKKKILRKINVVSLDQLNSYFHTLDPEQGFSTSVLWTLSEG